MEESLHSSVWWSSPFEIGPQPPFLASPRAAPPGPITAHHQEASRASLSCICHLPAWNTISSHPLCPLPNPWCPLSKLFSSFKSPAFIFLPWGNWPWSSVTEPKSPSTVLPHHFAHLGFMYFSLCLIFLSQKALRTIDVTLPFEPVISLVRNTSFHPWHSSWWVLNKCMFKE